MFLDLYQYDGRRRVFWNLNFAVGLRGSNAVDDVDFVRWAFGLVALRQRPIQRTLRDALAAAAKDREPFNPDEITATVQGIIAFSMHCHHRTVETEDDVRISPAKGVSHSRGFYTIIQLNYELMRILPNTFPRIDVEPTCPGSVRAKAVLSFKM